MTARTYRLTAQGQLTDRYTKAIAQPGDDQHDIRLGGIYAQERSAETSKRDHPTVVEVLQTFVSEHSRPRPGRGHRRPSPSTEQIATDVPAAINVLLRLPGHPGLPQIQLNHAHLPYVQLIRANLTRARLTGATLTGAHLDEADLTMAKDLTQQQLDSARGNEKTQLPAGLQRPAHWSWRRRRQLAHKGVSYVVGRCAVVGHCLCR